MNDRIFRSYSHQQPSRTAQQSAPKVVYVPVHFISSDQPRTTLSMLKDLSAVRIQRVFRGFLVRKSVKKIASIRTDVGEIERRIGDAEVADVIRRDAKERLRVNETLMSLLFKLDSIRGVDSGIRDLRKTVTRKAIALQEKVDLMARADVDDHQTLTLDSPNNDHSVADVDDQQTLTLDSPNNDHYVADVDDHQTLTLDSPDNDHSGKIDGNSEAVEDGDGVVKETIANCEVVKAADGCDVEDSSEMTMEYDTHRCVEDSMEVRQKDDDKGNREEFEKLMADNKKMKLMMQILERDEMQTRMINSLSRRVEQLEKAFMNDRMRRKNKKTKHVALRRRRDQDNFCIFSGNGL